MDTRKSEEQARALAKEIDAYINNFVTKFIELEREQEQKLTLDTLTQNMNRKESGERFNKLKSELADAFQKNVSGLMDKVYESWKKTRGAEPVLISSAQFDSIKKNKMVDFTNELDRHHTLAEEQALHGRRIPASETAELRQSRAIGVQSEALSKEINSYINKFVTQFMEIEREQRQKLSPEVLGRKITLRESRENNAKFKVEMNDAFQKNASGLMDKIIDSWKKTQGANSSLITPTQFDSIKSSKMADFTAELEKQRDAEAEKAVHRHVSPSNQTQKQQLEQNRPRESTRDERKIAYNPASSEKHYQDGLRLEAQAIKIDNPAEKDKVMKLAVACYQEAVNLKHVKAHTNLGHCYLNGQGCTQNKEKAFQLFTTAAEAGHARGQNNLARMLEKGDGVKKDPEKAQYWYSKGAQGDQIASDSKQGLEKTEQIQKLVSIIEQDYSKLESSPQRQEFRRVLNNFMKVDPDIASSLISDKPPEELKALKQSYENVLENITQQVTDLNQKSGSSTQQNDLQEEQSKHQEVLSLVDDKLQSLQYHHK